MKKLLKAENETSTAQRLGYIIERSGNSKLAEIVRDWLSSTLPLIPLVCTAGKTTNAPVIEKWRLLNNYGE